MLLKAALTWGVMACLMFVNGTVRELVVAPRIGVYAGYVVSVCTGALIIIGVTYFFIRKYWADLSRPDAWKIGGLWLALTMVFEFAMLRVSGVPWSQLLADYDLLHGRLWPVILFTVLLAPVFWLHRAWTHIR